MLLYSAGLAPASRSMLTEGKVEGAARRTAGESCLPEQNYIIEAMRINRSRVRGRREWEDVSSKEGIRLSA